MLQSMGSQRVGQDLATEQQRRPGSECFQQTCLKRSKWYVGGRPKGLAYTLLLEIADTLPRPLPLTDLASSWVPFLGAPSSHVSQLLCNDQSSVLSLSGPLSYHEEARF